MRKVPFEVAYLLKTYYEKIKLYLTVGTAEEFVEFFEDEDDWVSIATNKHDLAALRYLKELALKDRIQLVQNFYDAYKNNAIDFGIRFEKNTLIHIKIGSTKEVLIMRPNYPVVRKGTVTPVIEGEALLIHEGVLVGKFFKKLKITNDHNIGLREVKPDEKELFRVASKFKTMKRKPKELREGDLLYFPEEKKVVQLPYNFSEERFQNLIDNGEAYFYKTAEDLSEEAKHTFAIHRMFGNSLKEEKRGYW